MVEISGWRNVRVGEMSGGKCPDTVESKVSVADAVWFEECAVNNRLQASPFVPLRFENLGLINIAESGALSVSFNYRCKGIFLGFLFFIKN